MANKTSYNPIKGPIESHLKGYEQLVKVAGKPVRPPLRTPVYTDPASMKEPEKPKPAAVPELEPVYKDPETGMLFKVDPSKIDSRSRIYDVIEGERFRVDHLLVKRPGPYRPEHAWIPYQQYRAEEFERRMKDPQAFKEYVMKGRISRAIKEELTPEEQERLFRPTVSGVYERQAMEAAEPYTRREYWSKGAFELKHAVETKIKEWGLKTFTSLGVGAEIALRPEFYKSMEKIYTSGAAGFMAADIGRQTVEYAGQYPGEFVGQAATSALLFSGAGRTYGGLKYAIPEKIGPRIAMLTRGRFLPSISRKFHTFKPTKYFRTGVQQEIAGKGSLEVAVEQTHTNLMRGAVKIKMPEFAEMVKHPGKAFKMVSERAPGYGRRAAEYQEFEGVKGVTTKNVYTYIKETPPKYTLYKYDEMARTWDIRQVGGRRAHIRKFHPVSGYARIPATAGRYDVIRTGEGKQFVEYGGFDLLLKKPPKTTEIGLTMRKPRKPGPMKPFSPPEEIKPVSPGAAARSKEYMQTSGHLQLKHVKSPEIRMDIKYEPIPAVVHEPAFGYETMHLAVLPGPPRTGLAPPGTREIMKPELSLKFKYFQPGKIDVRQKDVILEKLAERTDIGIAEAQLPAMASMMARKPLQLQRRAYAFKPVQISRLIAGTVPSFEFKVPKTEIPATLPVPVFDEKVMVRKRLKKGRGIKHGLWIHPVLDPLSEIWGEL